MKVIGYGRVSRTQGREGESFLSPKQQREAVEDWCRRNGHEFVDWMEDRDQSGGTIERPKFQRALGRIEQGEANALCVAKLDRFGRSMPKIWQAVERLEAANATFVCVNPEMDLSQEYGRLMFNMLGGIAQFELDRLKAGWLLTKEDVIERRGIPLGPTPFGFRRKEDRTLEPDPDEAPVVREAFRIAGEDLYKAFDYLNEHGGRVWTLERVRRFLRNRVYLGEVRNGDLLNEKAHEPLVTQAQWHAAQPDAGRGRRPNEDYPLSGLVTCAACGSPMTGTHAGTGQRAYRCSNHRKCKAPPLIMADYLEQHVSEQLQAIFASHPGFIIQQVDPDALEAAEDAMLETERELDNFASDLTARKLLGDRYHDAMKVRVEAVEQAQAQYRELAKQSAQYIPADLSDLTNEELADLSRVLSITVKRGRLPIEQRVGISARDDGSRIPTA